MRFEQRKTQLVALTAAVWLLAIGFAAASEMRLAARPPTTLTLTTWPPAVRITIDGAKQFDGDYVITPVKLSMSPGRHRLTLARDGYFAQTSEIDDVNGRNFEMNNVVLQRDAALSFAMVELETPANHPTVAFQIDGGFSAGETPTLIDDLLADTPHVLTLYTPGTSPQEAGFRCRFRAPLPEPGMPPYKLKIRAQGQSYKVTGCTRLRDRKPAEGG